MKKFLSDEINEPIVKQYLEMCPKNTAYDSSDSLVALNSHLREKLINTLINAADLAIFADEATSAARKEMRLFLSAYDEEKNEVVIEFVSIASVSSTKSEILLNNNINISNTHFSCLDGTNAMSGEHTGYKEESTI